LQTLALLAEELKHELIGVMQQLHHDANVERIKMLTDKPFNQLTEAERAEIRNSQS
jgi:hypothetical protein